MFAGGVSQKPFTVVEFGIIYVLEYYDSTTTPASFKSLHAYM